MLPLQTTGTAVIVLLVLAFVLGISLVLFAQYNFKKTYRKYSKFSTLYKRSGSEVAGEVLLLQNVNKVNIVKGTGVLGDNFNPRSQTITLSEEVFLNNTISAQSVALHEAFHAVQYSKNSKILRLRTWLVPFVSVANALLFILLFASFFLFGIRLFTNIPLIAIFLILDLVIVSFQLVTVWVEVEASQKAIKFVKKYNFMQKNEIDVIKKILTSAGFTYVAGLFSSAFTIIPFVLILILISA